MVFSDDDDSWSFLGSDANELVDADRDGIAESSFNVDFREVLTADDGSGDEITAYNTSVGIIFIGEVRTDTTWSTKLGEARDFNLADDTPGPNDLFSNTDGFVCFTRGTLITTSRGEVAVQDLCAGDMVLTMDDGYQPIRWIGSRKLSAPELSCNPKLRPIRISAGAMGLNLPQQDLVVSRQHRMLVNSRISERMFDTAEVLVSAIILCAMPGIYVDEDVKQVEYFHMLFERHQVVYANGTPSESLFTGPEALKTLTPAAREEVETLFPEICAPEFEPTAAREIPCGKRQKKLMERHVKSANQLLMA